MKAVATRGHTVLVQLGERDEGRPLALVPAVVVDTRRGTVSAPRGIDTILAHGYWREFEGDPGPVLELVAAADLTAGAWDESKHPRDPGGEGGGQFIEKGQSGVVDPRTKPDVPAPAAVSRVLANAGFRPLPSGTPYSREGLRVKRGAFWTTVSADYDSPTEAKAKADTAHEILAEHYAVERLPDSDSILKVTHKAEEPSWEKHDDGSYRLDGWTIERYKVSGSGGKPFERASRKAYQGWRVKNPAGVTKATGDTLAGAKKNANRQIEIARRTLSAAAWDESKHPRDPGGEGGGQFVEKGAEAASGGEETPAEFDKRMKLTKVRPGWYATADGTYATISDGFRPGQNDEDGGAIYGEWSAVYFPNADGRISHNAGDNLDWFPTKKEAAQFIRLDAKRRKRRMTAAAFVEAEHPRHPAGTPEGGEFAPKGADGGPAPIPGPARDAEAAYYKATLPREAVTQARDWLRQNGYPTEAGGNSIQVVQAMEDHYPDGYEFFLMSDPVQLHKQDFKRTHMVNGDYTPERAAKHNAIRADYLQHARQPTDGQLPEALFMAGGSGSGKSSLLGKQENGIFVGGDIDAPDYAVYVNPDDIKELLPETEAMKAAGDVRWAGLSHEESSDIANRLRKDAQQAGFPLVIDGTGDSERHKFLGKVNAAEEAGYRTKVVLVDIPTEEAVRRAQVRARKTSRKVPVQTIRNVHQSVSERHVEWRDQIKDWEVWANDDAEQGGRRLIARRVNGGEIVVLDPERYAQVEAKAHG